MYTVLSFKCSVNLSYIFNFNFEMNLLLTTDSNKSYLIDAGMLLKNVKNINRILIS